jgi:cell division protein FtsQ
MTTTRSGRPAGKGGGKTRSRAGSRAGIKERARSGAKAAAKTGAGRLIDPRLQARRSSVARAEGLRRLWIVGGLTLVASVAIIAIAIINSPWLDVEQVSVVGAERSDPQQIVRASAIMVGDALVEIDSGAAAAAVMDVPWVAEATVSRSWSGQVTIEVKERVGVVALPTGSRYALVDASGQQVEVVAQRPDGFIPVTGVEESGVPGQPVSEDGQLVVSLIGELTAPVAGRTRSILVDEGRLAIELTTGERVDLGDDRALGDKLIALETVLARVDLTCIAIIDVRVPSNPLARATSRDAGADAADEEPYPGGGGC